MGLLSIIEDAADDLPLPRPETVIDNADPQVRQLLQIANSLGNDLMRGFEWSELVTEWNITTSADPHAETFPTARHRSLAKAVVWRTDSLTPLVGPVGSSNWQFLDNHVAGSFPGYWRNFGGALNIIGTGSGASVTTEYIANTWVQNAAGTSFYRKFQADDDTVRVAGGDEDLFKLGIIWRWKQRKGLDYAEDLQSFEIAKEQAQAADRDAKGVNMSETFRGDVTQSTWPGTIVAS